MGTRIVDRRDDIDGLRALAIVPVVMFHLKAPFFHGGFLGVDVFFVVSGYLIADIIFRETREGRFSILRFWERRIRRIFPALFAMIAVVALAGYFVMFFNEYRALGSSIAATVLFVSNLWFFLGDDYFNTAAQFQPLLHTWSLAVEEQFYLVFPLLMIALRERSRTAIVAALATLAVLSLALDVWLLRDQSAAAFYLPAPRAWELLLGATLAVSGAPAWTGPAWRAIGGWAGLLAILYAVVFLSASAQLAYPAAAWACGGAALLVVAGGGSGSLVSRALGLAPIAYLGRISYSLYLWHWPLIVGFKLVLREPDTASDRAVLIAASVILAVLSHEFVEKPFRAPASGSTGHRRAVFAAAGGAIAASLAFGFAVVAADGFASRFPPEVVRMIGYVDREDAVAIRAGRCFLSTASNDMRYFARDECLALDPARKNVLVIGDSFAAHLWPGLVAAYPDVNFLQATAAGCAPTLHNKRLGSVCGPLMEMAFVDWLPKAKVDAVILSGRWADGVDRDLGALADTIDYVKRFQSDVFVVGPMVEYEMPLPRILAASLLRGDPAMTSRLRESNPFASEGPLRAVATEHGARYLSPIDALCPGAACRTVNSEGVPLQFDYGHPTREGALFIAEQWRSRGAFDPG